ncbi:hypothetical protein J6590_080169 [Homalodisca vitripennis]|nr:hypothetical protein J6590_080169 [Homalodisca vitripennis]
MIYSVNKIEEEEWLCCYLESDRKANYPSGNALITGQIIQGNVQPQKSQPTLDDIQSSQL